MKNIILLLILIVLVVTAINCERKGSISDIAYLQQAQRSIVLVRNALEEYYMVNKKYPENNCNLEEVLKPYLLTKGDSISKWDKDIESAFAKGPFYTTEDPEINYFVKAYAKDSNKTPVTIRPATIRTKEEDKKKKG
jgi:type II secretory pathway pseudopilin PulG